jgi:DNA (cytosine-5)-methyltransferase 1
LQYHTRFIEPLPFIPSTGQIELSHSHPKHTAPFTMTDNPPPPPPALKVIDLFSGAGGFSLAALNCGLNVIAAVELDKDACKTYQNNIIASRSPKTKLYEKDIVKLDLADVLGDLTLTPGDLDILIGGPPCQGFSTHRINGKGVDDPRNQLLLRYFDFVRELRPRLFLVENVPGLLWPRHAAYLHDFQKAAKESGYTILGPVKLNAKNYGVPQNRERVFILGVRHDIDAEALVWPPAQTHFAPNTTGQAVWKNASVAFEPPPAEIKEKMLTVKGLENSAKLTYGKAISSKEADASAVHMQHTLPLVERFVQTPINGSRTDIEFRLPCHEDGYPGHKDVYGRIRLAQPGPTITTGCFNPSKGRFLHPWLHHGIAIRHAARLQTFPDDFVFCGGMTNQGKQVGNAVPVELGAHLLQCLKMFLAMPTTQNDATIPPQNNTPASTTKNRHIEEELALEV